MSINRQRDRPARAELYGAIERLQRLVDLFELRRRQLARAEGLSDEQWRVLEDIASDDFMPSLFARRRHRHPAAVSRTLRDLLERELVSVSISSSDARQREYQLTASGSRLLERVQARRERAIDAVWRGFAGTELRAFARFSTSLADRLEAYSRTRPAEP